MSEQTNNVVTETATPAAPPVPLVKNKFSRAFARRQWRDIFPSRQAWRMARQRGREMSFELFTGRRQPEPEVESVPA